MNVLSHPSAALKQRASEVDVATDPELKSLCVRMTRMMYKAEGIGLAATQIGVMKRVLVYDLDDAVVALCNPVIVESSDETVTDEEGCLSVPGVTVPVTRSACIVCEAQDLAGNLVRIEADGLLARLLQHEIDHLDGYLIIDRASPEDRKAAIRRYRELVESGGPQ